MDTKEWLLSIAIGTTIGYLLVVIFELGIIIKTLKDILLALMS